MTPQFLRTGAAALALALAASSPSFAADKIHAAKAVGTQFVFIPLDVGVEEGIFAKYDLDVEVVVMTGEARLQQGLTAGSLDFGIAGSPGAALSVKGAPVTAVAAFANAPRNFAVVVLADSPVKKAADLKGKTISGATTGGVPEWLVKRLAVVNGWGPDGIRSVSLGSPDASFAALRTKQVDGMMTATALGYRLEEEGAGRIVTTMGEVVPHFHTAMVFARTGLVQDNPKLVTRFLDGLFASIAYMKANKEKTLEIAGRILKQSHTVASRTYDNEMPSYSADGSFDPAAITVLKESFVEMGMLTEPPRDEQFLMTKFLPVKP